MTMKMKVVINAQVSLCMYCLQWQKTCGSMNKSSKRPACFRSFINSGPVDATSHASNICCVKSQKAGRQIRFRGCRRRTSKCGPVVYQGRSTADCSLRHWRGTPGTVAGGRHSGRAACAAGALESALREDAAAAGHRRSPLSGTAAGPPPPAVPPGRGSAGGASFSCPSLTLLNVFQQHQRAAVHSALPTLVDDNTAADYYTRSMLHDFTAALNNEM